MGSLNLLREFCVWPKIIESRAKFFDHFDIRFFVFKGDFLFSSSDSGSFFGDALIFV